MSDKDQNCKCTTVQRDPDTGTWRCMLCSQQYWPSRYRYHIKDGAKIDLKSLCEPIKLPYIPDDLPSFDAGENKLGTKRTDNLPL